jgi:hypothetical protein
MEYQVRGTYSIENLILVLERMIESGSRGVDLEEQGAGVSVQDLESKGGQGLVDEQIVTTRRPEEGADFVAARDGFVGDRGKFGGKTECCTRKREGAPIVWVSKRVLAGIKYIKQIQFQLRCTGKEWCDFVSFDPRLKGLEMFTKRVERDEKLISEMDIEVVKFLSDLDEKLELLMKEKNGTA